VDYRRTDFRGEKVTYAEFDAWLLEQARALPVPMNKGGTQQAQQNINTANAQNSQLFGESQAEQNTILPFLQQEMTNPQGFGQTGVNEMLTAGGEATSGAVGAGNEAANLRASRLGNPSSTASIIDAVARSGAAQQSKNALGVDQANLQEKLKQQQAGAAGIENIGNTDLKAALDSLGLSNQAVGDYTNAYKASNPLNYIAPIIGGLGSLGKGIGAAAGAFI